MTILDTSISHNGQGPVAANMPSNEAIVAAAMIYCPDIANRIVRRVKLSMFSDKITQALVRRAIDVLQAHGAADHMIIADEVIGEGNFQKEEVLSRTEELLSWSINARSSTDVALAQLIERANQFAIQDELHRLSADVNSGLLTSMEAVARLDELGQQVRGTGLVKLATLADSLVTDPADEPETILHTGFKPFDAISPEGGLIAGSKTVIAGAPGVGKSSLAEQIVSMALIANESLNVVWALGEMSIKSLRNRALQCLSGLTLGVLKRHGAELSSFQASQKTAAIDALKSIAPRWHVVGPILTPARIEAAVVQARAGLLVVDYIQLMKSDGTSTSRRDEIDDVVRSLTAMAQRHNLASIWLSSMPKGAIDNANVYSCFKESSEIAHAADQAYVLIPAGDTDIDDPEAPDEVVVRLRCLKARHGAMLSTKLRFNRPVQRFEGHKQ